MKLSGRTFPVLRQGERSYTDRLRALGCPRVVPWEFIAEHADNCEENHSQTPERLAERGGLAPAEMVAVVRGTHTWRERKAVWFMGTDEEVRELGRLLAEWERAVKEP